MGLKGLRFKHFCICKIKITYIVLQRYLYNFNIGFFLLMSLVEVVEKTVIARMGQVTDNLLNNQNLALFRVALVRVLNILDLVEERLEF